MNMLIRISWFVALVLLCRATTAQDFTDELLKVYNQFTHHERFYSKLQVRVFENEEAEQPLIKHDYLIKRDGNRFFYSLGGSDFLFNEYCTVVINRDEKYIQYGPYDKKIKSTDPGLMPDLKKTFQSIDSAVYKGTEGGYKLYTIYDYDGLIPVTDLYINEKHNCFHKLVYHYDHEQMPVNNKIEVEYIDWSHEPEFSEDEFSEWKYLSKIKGKIQLSNDYKGYDFFENND